MEPFYVSFLVILTYLDIPYAWIQFDQPFETKIQCEQHINNNWNELQDILQYRLSYQEIKSLQCKTKTEVDELNTQLGYPGPK